MPTPAPTPTIRRPSAQEIDALRKWLESQRNPWWRTGTPFSAAFGWADIFAADNWHCIYCGRDLAESEDVLAESTEDHLVPQALLTTGDAKAHTANNVAACCASCNGLKGPAVPEKDSPAWQSRAAYVTALRAYIDGERASRAAKYRVQAFKARAKRIWNKSDARQKDYL